MNQSAKIDDRFLQPLESVAKAIEMSEIPLLVMQANDHVAFVEQVSAVLGGTVIYASQSDFVEQVLASIPEFDYLFAVIDQPLVKRPYKLVRAYLHARDIMGADRSELAGLGVDEPNPKHRLILVVDRDVFTRHDAASQRQLSELCTVVAVS